ncbi:Uncharacterized protein OBRU01_14834 [Operophtera brumata]|uniref:Uncharacterized protein n=1 Tax=Operophtera brumata TaxID=104452 RepID=A0A0L7L5R2_OPEBR|nr:Uncharacterized protein OBRU01_14834 [Operophtera brumata]
MKTTMLLLFLIIPCFCQRPFFAGLRPIGYPDVVSSDGQGNNVNRDPSPAQLNQDTSHGDRLENQPFWSIKQQPYAGENRNPQTYPQRPSGYNAFTRYRGA